MCVHKGGKYKTYYIVCVWLKICKRVCMWSEKIHAALSFMNRHSNSPIDTVKALCLYTERQKKHHFFRVTLTKIHSIKINHIWTQISFNTS